MALLVGKVVRLGFTEASIAYSGLPQEDVQLAGVFLAPALVVGLAVGGFLEMRRRNRLRREQDAQEDKEAREALDESSLEALPEQLSPEAEALFVERMAQSFREELFDAYVGPMMERHPELDLPTALYAIRSTGQWELIAEDAWKRANAEFKKRMARIGDLPLSLEAQQKLDDRIQASRSLLVSSHLTSNTLQ